MQNKDKSDIIDEYSSIQQGSLVGKGNGILARSGKIKDEENYTNSLATMPEDEIEHTVNYGGKEYHGM